MICSRTPWIGRHRLKRSLRAVDLVMLGVGAIVGVGIFVLTGQAAANYAGPGILVSFLLAALACGCAALCYSEMASMIPIAGERLYVYICHHGRVLGLDNWLGSGP